MFDDDEAAQFSMDLVDENLRMQHPIDCGQSNQVIEGAYEKLLGSQYDRATATKSVLNCSGRFMQSPTDGELKPQHMAPELDDPMSFFCYSRRQSLVGAKTPQLYESDEDKSRARSPSRNRNRERVSKHIREGRLKLRLL